MIMCPWHRCFPVNLAKLPRTPFFTENLRATVSGTRTLYIKGYFLLLVEIAVQRK